MGPSAESVRIAVRSTASNAGRRGFHRRSYVALDPSDAGSHGWTRSRPWLNQRQHTSRVSTRLASHQLHPTVISPYSFPFRDTYTYWADVRFPQLTLPNIQRYELIVDCTCYSIPVPAQHLCVLLDLVTSKRRKKGICNM